MAWLSSLTDPDALPKEEATPNGYIRGVKTPNTASFGVPVSLCGAFELAGFCTAFLWHTTGCHGFLAVAVAGVPHVIDSYVQRCTVELATLY